jgi:hypothetical protein
MSLPHVMDDVPGAERPRKPEVFPPGKSLGGLFPRPARRGPGGNRPEAASRSPTGLARGGFGGMLCALVAAAFASARADGPVTPVAEGPILVEVGGWPERATLPPWFAGASGLVMTRSLASGTTTTIRAGDGPILSTSDAEPSWPGGVELTLGRWWGQKQRHGVEVVYWGLYGMGSSASVFDAANGLDGVPLVAPSVTIGSGGPAAAGYLLDARAQRISRNDLVNDAEVNWLFAPWGRPEWAGRTGRGVTAVWLAGFRFFQLQDGLALTSLSGSVPAGAGFGYAGGSEQVVLDVTTNNNLFGGQIGGKFDWHLTRALRLSAVPKVMVAGNAITTTSTLTSGDGTAAVFASGDAVNVHTTASGFSWLGSLDALVAWDVTDQWSLWIGYRLVGASGLAQADGSWPATITTVDSLGGIEDDTGTLVHGGFAGFQGRF